MRVCTRQARPQRGQSTVEFALVVPLVLVSLLAVAQVCVVAYAQLAVTHIARETARTLAVDPAVDMGAIIDTQTLLPADGLHIEATFEHLLQSDRETVSVSVRYEIAPVSGLFTTFLRGLTVHAEARLLVEA